MSKVPDVECIPHAVNVPKVDSFVYRRFGFNSYIPAEFTDFIDESMSWKTSCYIGDWSPLFKIIVTGPDAIRFFSDISVNGFSKFDIGQAKHAVFCNRDGMVTGDGVLMRLGEEKLFFQSGPGVPWAEHMFRKGSYDATCENVTREGFIFQVSGPNSLFVLEKATGESMRDIGFMRFREIRINGVPMFALRQGMAGEVGYELHGSSLHGREVYQAIIDAGQDFGIRRLGARAQQVNHVEACFPTSTVDYVPAMHGESERDFFNEVKKANPLASIDLMKNSGSYELKDNSDMYRTPVELGWGKNIKFDHDFLGKEALAGELLAPKRKMVTLVWNADDLAELFLSFFRPGDLPPFMEFPRHMAEHGMWADAVMKDGKVVGVTTGRCYSVYFREMLSLCAIDMACSDPGTEVTVLWGKAGQAQKSIRATVAPAPYKQDNRRVDVHSLPSYL